MFPIALTGTEASSAGSKQYAVLLRAEVPVATMTGVACTSKPWLKRYLSLMHCSHRHPAAKVNCR